MEVGSEYDMVLHVKISILDITPRLLFEISRFGTTIKGLSSKEELVVMLGRIGMRSTSSPTYLEVGGDEGLLRSALADAAHSLAGHRRGGYDLYK